MEDTGDKTGEEHPVKNKRKQPCQLYNLLFKGHPRPLLETASIPCMLYTDCNWIWEDMVK